jgi:NADH:ubiquinone oxidoreductase subunit E
MAQRRSAWITLVEPSGGDQRSLSRIQELVSGLRPDDADLLRALHRIQDAFGYVPREAISVLAVQFRTTPAIIFGTLSFYSEIRTAPPPEVNIKWCSGPACRLKGSENIRRALEAVLGLRLGQATPDNDIGLQPAQCDGTCHLAPLLRVNHDYVGPLTVSVAIELARKIKAQGAAAS